MRLVILLSMAALASSGSLNADLCGDGESFWCQSLAVAESCGAVNHCKEAIWKNRKLEEDESNICLFCKAVISDAREMSTAGKSENEVITFLSSASDLLSDVTKASQIKKTIQTKSLQNVLNSEITPQMVCSLLDVCRGALPFEEDLRKVESSAEETPEQPRKDGDLLLPSSCTDCTKFFKSLKDLITGATPPLLTDIILDVVCTRVGSFRPLCEQMATKDLPSAIKIAAGYLDPTKVCQLMRMCKKSQINNHEEPFEIDLSSIDWEKLLASIPTKNLVLEQPTETDKLRTPSSCTDCVNFFTSLKNILKNETPPFLTDIIVDQVCSRLGKYRKQCEEVVSVYLPSVIQFSTNFLDPNQICRLTRMCKKSQSELNSIGWTRMIIPNGTEGDSNTCEACKRGVQFVQTFLKSETVKTYIEAFVGNLVCAKLGLFHEACVKLVKTEIQMVLNLMARLMDPSKVCRMIRLCQKLDEVLDEDSLPVLEESEPLGPTECTACETVIVVISTAIDNNKTQEEILRAMHGLCDHLRFQQAIIMCNKLVDNYGAKVIDAIRKQLHPHDICAKFGLCVALNFDLLNAVTGSEPCVVCRSIVQYLEAYIDQSDTVSTIQDTLKTFCHSLDPGLEQQVCLPFVEEYIPWLVHELSVYMPPKFFCTKIRICTD